MSQSLRILFVLVFSCFFTHNTQAAFPDSIGDFGIRKTFENDWFDYGKNRLKLLRADDSAVTFFNVNCKNRKNISAKHASTAMENGMAVAKYKLLFNKKNTSHYFYLICKNIPSIKDVKFKESRDAGRLMKALELLSHGMGDGDVMLGNKTCYVSVLGRSACTSVMSITQYPITTAIIDRLNNKYSKLSTLEERVAQAVKDKCLKFDKEDELDGCQFYKIKFYPNKNSKKHTTLEIKIGRLSPECDCETATTMTTAMGTAPTTNAEAIDDLKFIVLRDGVIGSATTMDKRRIENQLVARSNDGSIRNIANILVTLGLDTNDPRKNEIAQQLLLSPTALAVATILSNEGLITVTQFNDIINKAPTLFGTLIHDLLTSIQFYNFENLFNGDHILTTTPSLYQDVADGAVGIRFSVTHDSIFDFFSQNTGNILPSITAGFDDWIMKHCSEMTVTASTMGGDVSSLKDMATSKTYPESFDYEAVFCMMQKHKPWWNCKGYRYRVDCKTKEHRTVWQRIQNNEMLVLKRTNKTEDGGRLYDLFSTMEPNKRLHRIRIDREKLHSPALGQKKYMQTNQAIGCMTDAFYNLALQSRGCGKVTIGGKEFMISPKEKLNGKTIDQKTQAKRLVRMAQYLKEEFKKPCLKERATKAARREKLRLKVLSESNDEICYKLWIQDNGKKLHSVYFTLKSTITMSLITNPQNALCKCVIEARNKMNMAIEAQKDIVGRLSVNGMQTPISVLLDLLTGDIGASYTTNLPRIRPAMNDVRAAYNKVKDLICTDLPADILACINASS